MIRPAKYTFTKSDYVAYRKQCQAILQHPRGRAALMDGGYYWRLAMGVVKWEDVLKGPSGLSLNMDEMVVIDDKVHGLLIDDRLTVKEANALCGTYKVPTGEYTSAFYQLYDLTSYSLQKKAIRLLPKAGSCPSMSTKIVQLILVDGCFILKTSLEWFLALWKTPHQRSLQLNLPKLCDNHSAKRAGKIVLHPLL